jgi:endonuclease YncB( thermonuclease family)
MASAAELALMCDTDSVPMWSLNGWSGVARVVDVADGDTFTVVLDARCAFDSNMTTGPLLRKFKVRILGIDTPELRSRDDGIKAAAKAAKTELLRLLFSSSSQVHNCNADITSLLASLTCSAAIRAALRANPVLVKLSVQGSDKYGRLLAAAQLAASGTDIAKHLLDTNHAVVYNP